MLRALTTASLFAVAAANSPYGNAPCSGDPCTGGTSGNSGSVQECELRPGECCCLTQASMCAGDKFEQCKSSSQACPCGESCTMPAGSILGGVGGVGVCQTDGQCAQNILPPNCDDAPADGRCNTAADCDNLDPQPCDGNGYYRCDAGGCLWRCDPPAPTACLKCGDTCANEKGEPGTCQPDLQCGNQRPACPPTDLTCKSAADCPADHCCVESERPIGRRLLAASCVPMGAQGDACYVNDHPVDSDRASYYQCPCSGNLVCEGTGVNDVPLGEMGVCNQGGFGCTDDVQECPDGTYVSRVGPNCEFEKCPTDPVGCTEDLRLCPDGSYVGRSPPKCEFDACPESSTKPPVDPVVCPLDVQECRDGSYVSRVAPDCEFAPCPDTPVPCTKDAKICPDGSAVGRSGPKCEFEACPESSTKPPLDPVGPGGRTKDDDNTAVETGTVGAAPGRLLVGVGGPALAFLASLLL